MLIDDLDQLPVSLKIGVRGILLIHRKKDGCAGNPQRTAIKRISNTQNEWTRAILELKQLQVNHYPNRRIYASVNRRNMAKAIHEFKRRQLEADFGGYHDYLDFYSDIENRFFSCLMNPGSKEESNFLIDCDIEEEYENAIQKLPREKIIADYATKNGRHIITEPFNPTEYQVQIKKDDLIYIG